MMPFPPPPFPTKKVPNEAALAARPKPPVLNLTMSGLDSESREALERALIQASKSGRFMISIFTLVPEEGKQFMEMKSSTIKSANFPVQEFNLCQDHLHNHLADMSASAAVDVSLAENVPADGELIAKE